MKGKFERRLVAREGFTLVELMVVVLVLGTLAALAMPAFASQKDKGHDACAKAMARTMQTAMETRYTDRVTYDDASPSVLNQIESQVPPSGTGSCGSSTPVATGVGGSGSACAGDDPGAGGGYCVAATSASGRSFIIDRTAAGLTTRHCSTVGGGCRSDLTW